MDISERTIRFALRVAERDEDPATTVERLYVIADLMEATDKAITCAWGRLGSREDAVQDVLTDYDFFMRAKDLRKLADEWQGEVETQQAQRDEAEDRRRDNPLEPDFRRLGQ